MNLAREIRWQRARLGYADHEYPPGRTLPADDHRMVVWLWNERAVNARLAARKAEGTR